MQNLGKCRSTAYFHELANYYVRLFTKDNFKIKTYVKTNFENIIELLFLVRVRNGNNLIVALQICKWRTGSELCNIKKLPLK